MVIRFCIWYISAYICGRLLSDRSVHTIYTYPSVGTIAISHKIYLPVLKYSMHKQIADILHIYYMHIYVYIDCRYIYLHMIYHE